MTESAHLCTTKQPTTADAYISKVEEGISLVTCCMNRNQNLIKAVSSWLNCEEINEIIIVDWSSHISVINDLRQAGIQDSRLLVVRVENQPSWILSHAFNLGFRMACYSKIIKADADIVLYPSFFEKNLLTEQCFLSGDWRVAETEQKYINGFFFAYRSDLMHANGFNEYITTYGWDDDDLYSRLEKNGVSRHRIDPTTVHHLSHTDIQRIKHSEKLSSALAELRAMPDTRIISNKFIASVMPEWNQNRVLLPFELIPIEDRYIKAQPLRKSFYQVPTHIQQDADYYGLCTVLSWSTELSAYSIVKADLYSLLKARSCFTDVTKADVRLASFSQQGIRWQRNLAIVYFEAMVPISEAKACIQLLLQLTKQYEFTLFVEIRVFNHDSFAELRSHPSLLSLFPGFYKNKLPEHSVAEMTQNILSCFQQTPAFWTLISLEAVRGMLKNPKKANS